MPSTYLVLGDIDAKEVPAARRYSLIDPYDSKEVQQLLGQLQACKGRVLDTLDLKDSPGYIDGLARCINHFTSGVGYVAFVKDGTSAARLGIALKRLGFQYQTAEAKTLAATA